MFTRPAMAACLACLLLFARVGPAAAQADEHARAVARANCQSGKQSGAVKDASAAMDSQPDELGPRLRLADALVDTGCYQEAVAVLEAGEAAHPRNAELAGKLRDVRSLVTEQTYIEGLTQAAESAKFQRNQLRCLRMSDSDACDDALKIRPDDVPLLVAKGDALMQERQGPEATSAYRHALQVKPGDEGIKTKLAAAQALHSSATAVVAAAPSKPPAGEATVRSRVAARPAVVKNTAGTSRKSKPAERSAAVPAGGSAATPEQAAPAAVASTGVQHATTTPAVAALDAPENRSYSNEAPAGRTN